MEPKFWHERWELNEIGFHQSQVNPLLIGFWKAVYQGQGKVFVPLCGKSLDLVWLRGQGQEVLGVELSPIAVSEFFREHEPEIHQLDKFQSHARDGIQLLCGDFFDLSPRELKGVKAVYDRAALIALPNELQARYVERLLTLLPERPPLLLITLEYDPAEMAGPPFSTPKEKVLALFSQAYRIELLESREILDENPGLKNRGLSRLVETAYALTAL